MFVNKSIKLSKYFSIIKPQYIFLKITPDKSIRNSRTDNIAKAISYMYKTISKRIHIEQRKLFFETSFKVSYIIDITKDSTNFYFMVPEVYKSILVEKVTEVWPKATVTSVDKITQLNAKNTVSYQLSYKYKDALSLDVDRKSNEPLNSLLNVIDIMKEQDRVVIAYNFIPHKFYSWGRDYKDTMQMVKDNRSIIRDKASTEYLLKTGLNILSSILNAVVQAIGEFLGDKAENINFFDSIAATLEKHRDFSVATKKKKECILLDTQIAVLSSSEDSVRAFNNASTVCSAFNSISEDNELVYRKTKDVKLLDTDIRTDHNTFSSEECSNFIQLPGRDLMDRLGVKYINTNEIKIPSELQEGYISLGTNKYKGKSTKAYIEDKYNVGSLPLVLVGAQGSGKTTYIANYYKMSSTRNEGGVLIDFIKNCELADKVESYLDKNQYIELDLGKEEDIQGFAFNEIDMSKYSSTFKKLEMANLQAQQVKAFVNAINPEQPLQARMNRYLGSAAQIVFSTGETSLREVIRCLENCKVRKSYLDKIPVSYVKYIQDEIEDMKNLDDYDKKTGELIGTKEQKIEGILDRMSALRGDFKLKYMFNKGGQDNLNFVDALEHGKLIIIKMRQSEFKQYAKNIITTFLLSKIWLATEIRGALHEKPKQTHVAIDELFQTKTAMQMLSSGEIIPQTRKFGAKFIISCQYTGQMDILTNTLAGAGASFMFLNGTLEEDYIKFKNKLDNFDYDDIKNMESHSSLNLIYYSKGYAKFITKLPNKFTK